MPNQRQRAAGTVAQIDGVTIAKITSVRETNSLEIVDLTGVEDISGGLVQTQRDPVAVETTLQIEGIMISGEGESTPQDMEPGQQDLYDAMRAGTEAVLSAVAPSGFGFDYTGFISNFERGFGGVKEVYTFTASFVVNSYSAVTP